MPETGFSHTLQTTHIAVWRRAVDLILPPLCLQCDAPVVMQHTLCPACWTAIHFLTPPLCACCGAPFDSAPLAAETAADFLCGSCVVTTPYYTSARAAMLYDDASKNLALGFKHGDRIYLAKALGTWMHQAGQAFLADADFIVPVPLHRWRLFHRRYNQAALLAHMIGKLARKTVLPDALLRQRATPQQGHMNRAQRQDNVRGAFMASPRFRARLDGKKLVLIDDVLTTGATVNECAKALREVGALQVDVLTVARVKSTG